MSDTNPTSRERESEVPVPNRVEEFKTELGNKAEKVLKELSNQRVSLYAQSYYDEQIEAYLDYASSEFGKLLAESLRNFPQGDKNPGSSVMVKVILAKIPQGARECKWFDMRTAILGYALDAAIDAGKVQRLSNEVAEKVDEVRES